MFRGRPNPVRCARECRSPRQQPRAIFDAGPHRLAHRRCGPAPAPQCRRWARGRAAPGRRPHGSRHRGRAEISRSNAAAVAVSATGVPDQFAEVGNWALLRQEHVERSPGARRLGPVGQDRQARRDRRRDHWAAVRAESARGDHAAPGRPWRATRGRWRQCRQASDAWGSRSVLRYFEGILAPRSAFLARSPPNPPPFS